MGPISDVLSLAKQELNDEEKLDECKDVNLTNFLKMALHEVTGILEKVGDRCNSNEDTNKFKSEEDQRNLSDSSVDKVHLNVHEDDDKVVAEEEKEIKKTSTRVHQKSTLSYRILFKFYLIRKINTTKLIICTLEKTVTTYIPFVLMLYGVANLVLGSLNWELCRGANVLPVFLVINGITFVVPFFLLVNYTRPEDVVVIYKCVRRFFIVMVIFLFYVTIYTIVSAIKEKLLCTKPEMLFFTVAVIVFDWAFFSTFFIYMCFVKEANK